MAQIKTNLQYGVTGSLQTASYSSLDATKLSGNLPAISGASLTTLNASNVSSGTLNTARYVDNEGGITHASTWRLNTQFNGSATPIASNWEEFDMYQNVSATALLGSSMTQSSGIFTFPSTGFYYIWFQYTSNEESNLIYQNRANIKVTLDNSNWKQGSTSMSNVPNQTYTATWLGVSLILDVTNTTNVKCRFDVEDDGENAQTILASTGENRTYATFVRLGDT